MSGSDAHVLAIEGTTATDILQRDFNLRNMLLTSSSCAYAKILALAGSYSSVACQVLEKGTPGSGRQGDFFSVYVFSVLFLPAVPGGSRFGGPSTRPGFREERPAIAPLVSPVQSRTEQEFNFV